MTKFEILSFIIYRVTKATKTSVPKDIVVLKTKVLDALGCDFGLVRSEFAQMAQAITHIFTPNAVVEEELVDSILFLKGKAKGNGHRLMVVLVHWPGGQICLQDVEDILAVARKHPILLEELWKHAQSIHEAQTNFASRE